MMNPLKAEADAREQVESLTEADISPIHLQFYWFHMMPGGGFWEVVKGSLRRGRHEIGKK